MNVPLGPGGEGLFDLFEASPACLAIFTAESPYRVIDHNPAFQKVLDEPHRTNGVRGLSIPEFAKNPENVLDIYRKVVETQQAFSIENYRFDGLERGPTWWCWSLTPVVRLGQVKSLVLTSIETTTTVQAQEALEEKTRQLEEVLLLLAKEKELFQRIVDLIPAMITVYDADRNLSFVNKAFEDTAGWNLKEAQTEPVFELCYPDPEYRKEISEFMAKCEGWMDVRMRTRDGRVVDTTWSNVKLSDDRQVGIGIDMSDRIAAQREIEHSKAFLAAVLETAPIGISVARDPSGAPPLVNHQAREMMGIDTLEGGLERYEQLPIFDRDGSRFNVQDLAISRALAGEEITEREIIYRKDRENRRWLVNARPLKDEGGAVIAAIASFLDIEDRKRAEEARHLLVDELNHRVKNTLAVVQSLANNSFRNTKDPSKANSAFQARLQGLAAAHDLLTRENWSEAMLSDIFRAALLGGGVAPDHDRLVLDIATDERVAPKVAVSISMMLHEFITNALIHGALCERGGTVELKCDTARDDPGGIVVEWIESCDQEVSATSYQGFGLKMIRLTVERELKGTLDMSIKPSGMKATIEIPRANLRGA